MIDPRREEVPRRRLFRADLADAHRRASCRSRGSTRGSRRDCRHRPSSRPLPAEVDRTDAETPPAAWSPGVAFLRHGTAISNDTTRVSLGASVTVGFDRDPRCRRRSIRSAGSIVKRPVSVVVAVRGAQGEGRLALAEVLHGEVLGDALTRVEFDLHHAAAVRPRGRGRVTDQVTAESAASSARAGRGRREGAIAPRRHPPCRRMLRARARPSSLGAHPLEQGQGEWCGRTPGCHGGRSSSAAGRGGGVRTAGGVLRSLSTLARSSASTKPPVPVRSRSSPGRPPATRPRGCPRRCRGTSRSCPPTRSRLAGAAGEVADRSHDVPERFRVDVLGETGVGVTVTVGRVPAKVRSVPDASPSVSVGRIVRDGEGEDAGLRRGGDLDLHVDAVLVGGEGAATARGGEDADPEGGDSDAGRQAATGGEGHECSVLPPGSVESSAGAGGWSGRAARRRSANEGCRRFGRARRTRGRGSLVAALSRVGSAGSLRQ